MAQTSMGLAVVSGHDVVLPMPLIPRDTMRWAVGLTTVPQWQQPEPRCLLRLMPIMPWVPRWVFFFRVELATDFITLLSVSLFACCFQVHMWLPCSSMGTQPFGFITPHYFGVCPMKGICASWYWSMAHARSTLSGFSFHCFK